MTSLETTKALSIVRFRVITGTVFIQKDTLSYNILKRDLLNSTTRN